MDDADFQRYWKERYEDQLAWYGKKSARNKAAYLGLRGTILATVAAVPVTLIADAPRLVPTVLSAVVMLLEGLLSLLRCHENWISYRSNAEMLKKEGNLYRARIGEYGQSADPQGLFVARIEALVSREHTFWRAVSQRPEKQTGTQGEQGGSD